MLVASSLPGRYANEGGTSMLGWPESPDIQGLWLKSTLKLNCAKR
jgi:hypothetical protein